jgi:NAD(P)-dependent dehydrogenase (short-subunit alcohol dehydrogenase family)
MSYLNGKVVLVTGGGNGIGRQCALIAAQNGAKVVVADVGSKVDGSAAEDAVSPAQAVVNEIKAAGGEAVANHGSVTDRAAVKQMVEEALDRFGALHAIMNPAGILRDKMFHKMEEADWDAVIDVHLNGTYNVCRAAIEHFRNQQDGSLVLFTSTSGIIGNIGQANYAAAKMGIVGLSRSIAIEGKAKGIRSNVIAPFAWTRMLEQVPITSEAQRVRYDKMRTTMRADQVATFSVALCGERAKDVTGQIFAVRANEIFLMSQPRIVRGLGRTDGWTPDSIADSCLPAMRPEMLDLSVTADVFKSDPI